MNDISTFDELKEALLDQLKVQHPSVARDLPVTLTLPTKKTLTLTLEPGDEGSVALATITLTGDLPTMLRVTRNTTDRAKLQINGGPSTDVAGTAANIAQVLADLAEANARMHRK